MTPIASGTDRPLSHAPRATPHRRSRPGSAERGFRAVALASLLLGAACALPPSTVVVAATPAPDSSRTAAPRPQVERSWPLRVREHVDLWLHGFALVHDDSSLVPYYRAGYRERVNSARGTLRTTLDTERDRLRARLNANPALVNAQFVALYFDTWDALRRGVETFLIADGDPRRAGDARSAQDVATFAAYFPASADREWLQRFVAALTDERARFFGAFWREEQRRLGPVFDRADLMWRTTYRARFAHFLTNSRQREGEILLAMPLAGEGRTLAVANRVNSVAVGLPTDTTAAAEVFYTFAHEVVGAVAGTVVTDHTTPAEQRSGEAARHASLAAVRGGAMLLQRIAPELVEGYQRSYLSWARVPLPSGESGRIFEATYPLPEAIREALARQIDHILGGI